jgi:SAM-dependent methyltransferase
MPNQSHNKTTDPLPLAVKQLLSPRFSYRLDCHPVVRTTELQTQFIQAVKEHLIDGAYRLRHYGCPCGSTLPDIIIAEVDRYGLPLQSVLCQGCGSLRFDPYLEDAGLAHFYSNCYQQMYGRAVDVERYFARQQQYGQKILATLNTSLPPESRVLEVGCGAGGALSIFRDNGHEVAGCEYDKHLLEFARRQCGTKLRYGSLEDFCRVGGNEKYNLLYLHHVFEHLNDPVSFLRTAKQCLSAQGRIVIIVPDVSRIDQFPDPGGDLLPYLHIAHKFNFSMVGVARLSGRAGFRTRELKPDNQLKTSFPGPELWIELFVDKTHEVAVSAAPDCSPCGVRMLNYLLNTEALFQSNLHPVDRPRVKRSHLLERVCNYVGGFGLKRSATRISALIKKTGK